MYILIILSNEQKILTASKYKSFYYRKD